MTYRCEIFFTTERVIRCDLQYELFVEALFKSIFTISLLTGPVGLPVLSLFYPCAACGVARKEVCGLAWRRGVRPARTLLFLWVERSGDERKKR